MDKNELLVELKKSLLELSKQFKALSESVSKLVIEPTKDVSNDEQLELPFEEEKKETISLEEVRRVLASKSRDGFTKEVRDLITKFGATRLSEINPERYAEVLKAGEEIGNA